MKNKHIRIISVIMAACVLLGTYGCKSSDKNKEASTSTTAATQASTENQSDNENIATSKFEYTSLDANKKEVPATGVVEYDTRALYNTVRTGETLKAQMDNDKDLKDKLRKHIDNYQIDEKQYEEIVNKAEEWVSFEIAYIVVNPTPTRIAFDRISHENKDGIIVNDYGSVGSEISIGSAQDIEILIEGLYDISKYPDVEAVKDALNEMNLKVVYISTENINQTISDFDNPQFKTLPIKFEK